MSNDNKGYLITVKKFSIMDSYNRRGNKKRKKINVSFKDQIETLEKYFPDNHSMYLFLNDGYAIYVHEKDKNKLKLFEPDFLENEFVSIMRK